MLYSDLFNFHRPGDPQTVDHWDNGDWDGWHAPAEANIKDFEACGDYCKADERCVQWSWRGRDAQQCILMRSIRYGQARDVEVIEEPYA